MYCSKCGKEIDEGSAFCKHCGAPQQQPNEDSATPVASPLKAAKTSVVKSQDEKLGLWLAWVGGGVAVFALIAILGSQTPTNSGSPLTANSSEALSSSDPSLDVQNIADGEIDNALAAADAAINAANAHETANWLYSENQDKVRGSTSYYATATSTNTIHQDPPYDDETSMTLTVRRAPAFGTDVLLTISSGQMMCPSYEGCSGTVSFDGGPPETISFNGPADNSSDTIFVEGAKSFVAKLKKSKKVVIEKTLYEAGNPQFEFDVHGLKWDH